MNKFKQFSSDDYQMSVAGGWEEVGPRSNVWGNGGDRSQV